MYVKLLVDSAAFASSLCRYTRICFLPRGFECYLDLLLALTPGLLCFHCSCMLLGLLFLLRVIHATVYLSRLMHRMDNGYCTHAVQEGHVRLVARVDVNGFATGGLQVFVNGGFGSVCAQEFRDRDARVACPSSALHQDEQCIPSSKFSLMAALPSSDSHM